MRHPQLWFLEQAVAYLGSRHLALQEPAEFDHGLHRRHELIALTTMAGWML
jgi:hypothetical protein